MLNGSRQNIGTVLCNFWSLDFFYELYSKGLRKNDKDSPKKVYIDSQHQACNFSCLKIPKNITCALPHTCNNALLEENSQGPPTVRKMAGKPRCHSLLEKDKKAEVWQALLEKYGTVEGPSTSRKR